MFEKTVPSICLGILLLSFVSAQELGIDDPTYPHLKPPISTTTVASLNVTQILLNETDPHWHANFTNMQTQCAAGTIPVQLLSSGLFRCSGNILLNSLNTTGLIRSIGGILSSADILCDNCAVDGAIFRAFSDTNGFQVGATPTGEFYYDGSSGDTVLDCNLNTAGGSCVIQGANSSFTVQSSRALFLGNLSAILFNSTQDKWSNSTNTYKLADFLAQNGETDVLFDYFSDVGNSGTDETRIFSDVIPANQLSDNGEKLSAAFTLTSAGSATATSQFEIYINQTKVYDSGALGFSLSTDTNFNLDIIRESTRVIRVVTTASTTTASAIPYVTYNRTSFFSANANFINVTATRSGVGASSNDIVGRMGYIQWVNNA